MINIKKPERKKKRKQPFPPFFLTQSNITPTKNTDNTVNQKQQYLHYDRETLHNKSLLKYFHNCLDG